MTYPGLKNLEILSSRPFVLTDSILLRQSTSYYRNGTRPNNSENPILVRQKNVPAIQSNAFIGTIYHDYVPLLHFCQ